MAFDEAAREAVMKLGLKAQKFDHGRRYEEAIYFYTESANRILLLVGQKKILPILKKQAIEFIERAEFLKKDLPRLQELAKVGSFRPYYLMYSIVLASKSLNQLNYEKAEFCMYCAQDLDEKEHYSLALDQYSEAISLCLRACEACTDEDLRNKMKFVAAQALARAEQIKDLEKQLTYERLAEQLPDVPPDHLSRLELDHKAPPSLLDLGPPRIPGPSPAPARNSNIGNLTREELDVLAVNSSINGKKYVPFLTQDLNEKFYFTLPFTDKDGKLRLTEKQKKKIKAWLRPSEFLEDPKLIKNIDSGTIKQTIISDCSFVSSLSIAARYEKRFGKQLVTSIIYPQNKAGIPIFNSDGKYMVKLHINGVWRKVIIDDYFPTGEGGGLLCSYSQLKGELWVSLLEKAYMKVMGGYDFPGSNSNIDLHALTSWIPERISIKKDSPDFDSTKIFEKLLTRYHRGDCLITLATGKLDQADCDRAGLVDSHAYAVLDLRYVENKRLLMVKNPWTHLPWKGRYSEKDEASWTSSLMTALDYDPAKAQKKDDGVFWIDLDSVCNFFDVFYVNWNPSLFPHTMGFHAKWNACAGPVKDLYSVADNPQYLLEVNNKGKSAVWILLTRHITDIADFADNKEYITVMVYKSGKKMYYPFDPKPLYDGVRINSPHYLCQMVIDDVGVQKYTLVVAQYEKMNTIHYTLRVYSSTDFNLAPMKLPYKEKKTITSSWDGKSAAGCGNGSGGRENFKLNPSFHICLEDRSDDNALFVELKGPKQYSVGFEVSLVSSYRQKQFETVTSGSYRPGYCVLALDGLPGGTYSVRPSTFLAAQEGPFILKAESSCGFSFKKAS